jgi:hypothetical protein
VKRAAAKRPAGRAQDSGGDAPSHRPAACGLWQRRRPQPLCRAHSGRRETLYFAAALAIVVVSLVIFQWNNQRVKEFEKAHPPEVQARAQSEMFQGKQEEREIRPDETQETAPEKNARPKRPRA